MSFDAPRLARPRGRRLIRLVTSQAVALLLALLVLGGCGESKPADPFVGTWIMQGGGARWVITPSDGEYTIYHGYSGERDYGRSEHYVRSGDTLSWAEFPGTTTLRLDERGDMLFLRIDDGTPLIKKVTLTRESHSTATPIPVP